MTGSPTEPTLYRVEDFSAYVTEDGRYVRVMDNRPRPAAYRINVKFKPNRSSLVYSSDCQMFAVEP